MNREMDEIRELKDRALDPFTVFHDILKNWWVILMGMIAAALLTYVVANVSYEPKYTTSTTFVAVSKSNGYMQTNLTASYDITTTFKKILQSNMMEKIICEKLNMEEVDAEITAKAKENTNMLVLDVTASSAKDAIDIMQVIMENYSSISFYSVGNSVLEVLQEPAIPLEPDNPKDIKGRMQKTALITGALLALLIGLGSYLSDTIKQEPEIEQKLDARSLGEIGYEMKYKTLKEWKTRKKSPILVSNPLVGFRFVEQYKKLALKVDHRMSRRQRKVLVVTSVSENEGKSTVAANLAISLAKNSKNVLLIDGDLRRESQFLIFGKEKEITGELGEFLKGTGEFKDLIQKSDIKNLYLMVGKNCYNSSTELIQSDRMRSVIDTCKEKMDYIIIDSPPVGLLGDAEILASYSDAVMLVAKQNFMLAEDINEVLDRFRAQHTKVLGVMLNNVKSFSSGVTGTYYGKYNKYGNYSSKGKE